MFAIKAIRLTWSHDVSVSDCYIPALKHLHGYIKSTHIPERQYRTVHTSVQTPVYKVMSHGHTSAISVSFKLLADNFTNFSHGSTHYFVATMFACCMQVQYSLSFCVYYTHAHDRCHLTLSPLTPYGIYLDCALPPFHVHTNCLVAFGLS